MDRLEQRQQRPNDYTYTMRFLNVLVMWFMATIYQKSLGDAFYHTICAFCVLVLLISVLAFIVEDVFGSYNSDPPADEENDESDNEEPEENNSFSYKFGQLPFTWKSVYFRYHPGKKHQDGVYLSPPRSVTHVDPYTGNYLAFRVVSHDVPATAGSSRRRSLHLCKFIRSIVLGF